MYNICISVLHVLVCLFERNRDHLCASEDSIFCIFPCRWNGYSCWCVWLYLYVCVSDPSVAPSPASSFSAPYKKGERTLNARMYHPCQFSFYSPCVCFLICKIISQPLIDKNKDIEKQILCFLAYKKTVCNQ